MDQAELLDLLRTGEVSVEGRMPWSSNATILVTLVKGEARTRAVYKPALGERPLWDYPSGLFRREAAAWELSQVLGWGVVPITIVRDGPHGIGSFQHFVDADFSEHYFTLREHPLHLAQLRRMCTYDLLANSGDRKSGHVLVERNGSAIWGIDNGLSFHIEDKLRTVLWDFAGQPVDEALLPDIDRLAGSCDVGFAALVGLLDSDEIGALRARAADLLDHPVFPESTSNYDYPWPLV